MEKDIKAALIGAGFNFKKKFGQNFITDGDLLNRIVDGAGVTKDDTVIEIGCGAGTLTRAIAKKARFVYGYEIDKSLQPVLARTLSGAENVEIIFKDFLRLRLDELEKNLPEYKVVANLPYYITTPLITMLTDNSVKCKSLTVMVQEEVALRLCAKPATSDYGAITANLALRGECRLLEKVGREKFTPSPNVDSAVVRIDFTEGRLKLNNKETYKNVVRAAFSSRRKTLENNLKNCFNLSREKAAEIIAECGFNKNVRGEELSPENFAYLSDKLDGII